MNRRSKEEGALVLAFGGNAMLPDPGRPDAQTSEADEFASVLSLVLPKEAGACLVHGNGPQVGMILLRIEETRERIPPETLDILVAETQGSMGCILSRAIRNRIKDLEVASILTQVVVDPIDPAFRRPEKPVGPFYSDETAFSLRKDRGWSMALIPGKGWRRTVPSPAPIDIVEIHTIVDAVSHGHIAIAGGGGGVPVSRDGDGRIRGVEAVVDKDLTASLIAVALRAESLIILTDVPHVSLGFGTEAEVAIDQMKASEASRLLSTGEFPPGSMGPKVEACIKYVKALSRPALITDVHHLREALVGDAGTWILP